MNIKTVKKGLPLDWFSLISLTRVYHDLKLVYLLSIPLILFFVLSGNCNKLLDSTTCTEHDGDAFCKSCYGKLFGPKGYGFAGGSSGLSMDTGNPHQQTRRWWIIPWYIRYTCERFLSTVMYIHHPTQQFFLNACIFFYAL